MMLWMTMVKLMLRFCFQGDGKDGGDEGGGERSGWGASQVKIFTHSCHYNSVSFPSGDSITVTVTSIPKFVFPASSTC